MQRVNNENLRYFGVHTAAICFTSDSSFTSAHKNNKKREAALKKEAGGDEKHVGFFFAWPYKTGLFFETGFIF